MANDVELSERECEILRLVATGASNKEIAQSLFISANTVKVHMRNIFAKIEVTSRTEATLYAIRAGLVPAPVEFSVMSTSTGDVIGSGVVIPGGNGHSNEELAPPFVSPEKPRSRPTIATVALAGLLLVVMVFGTLWVTRTGMFAPAITPTSPTLNLNRWMSHASLPAGRTGLAAAAYESRIYAIGGETNLGVTDLVNRYDPEQDAWEQMAQKPLAVSDIQAALLGERIYVPGGKRIDGTITDWLEVYNPRQNTWEQKTALPAPRSAYALATYEGRLYLFGGWDGRQVVKTVFEYDPILDTWTERSSMPTARAYSGAAVAAGKIYVVGGRDGEHLLNVNEVYYPQREQDGESGWETAAPLPEARSHLALTALADSLYLFGGHTEGSGTSSAALGYIPGQNSWQTLEAPPQTIGEHATVVAVGNFVNILGGKLEGKPDPGFQSYQAIFTVVLPYLQ